MRKAAEISLSPEEERRLDRLSRSNTVPVRERAVRALCCWRRRGRRTRKLLKKSALAESRLADGALVTRKAAAATGISASTIRRVWKAHGLKPHRVETFKVSRDPRFVEILEDIVGLYLNPPEHALVLCCDEKSQVQALDRTQPGLPLKKGRAASMTHDHKRHGTTTLFAALNVLDGTVIGQCRSRHRHTEWLSLLRKLDRETPKDKKLHLIFDNYATHKHPNVQRWLDKHPRFHIHFTPTSASWLNMVELFFRDLTTQQLRRGVFHSVPQLVKMIEDYIAQHNENPKPFIWTAKANDIPEKVVHSNKQLSPKQNGALH